MTTTTVHSTWQTAPSTLSLVPGEVHLWRIDLAVPEARLLSLTTHLTIDERARAARFHFPIHRNRFTVARAALRQILALYLKQDAATLQFSYYPLGKPFLAGNDLHFNLSHSATMAVCALTRQAEIGVDIESVATDDHAGIAERFFSHEEYIALQALPESARGTAFYQIWSKKEALVKAWGLGITAPLQAFSVSIEQETDVTYHPQTGLPWSVTRFITATGYESAYALKQLPELVYYWQWV